MNLAGGPITQIAWVVSDVAAAEGFLGACLGVRSWNRMPDIRFGPDSCTYRGAPADFTAHISLSYSGATQLELVEPVRGESIYSEFLRERGPGLHHICVEPEDFDAALRAATAAGTPVVQQGDMGGQMRFAYLDGSAAGVPYVELAQIGPHMRALFDRIRQSA